MKAQVLAAVGFLALLAAGPVRAGQLTPVTLRATIDFAFVVEGKTLPPGTYDFTLDSATGTFRVQAGTKEGAIGQIMTQTATAIHTTMGDAHIVFDEVGGKEVLAEIWIPGQDGFILHIQKGPHAHKVINVAR